MKKARLVLTVMICVLVTCTQGKCYASEKIAMSPDVTSEMCKPEYWSKRARIAPNAILMSTDEVRHQNQLCLSEPSTGEYNLEAISEDEDYLYGVVVKRTNILSAPSDNYKYTEEDSYPKEMLSTMNVNEPFLIDSNKTSGGYYYGYSNHYEGWVSTKDVAICRDRQEWLEAWKVDLDDRDFIVVTQNKIYLEPSLTQEYSSELMLGMGTVLKLIEEEKLPEADFAERASWNNYAVYVPTRGVGGEYEKRVALIPQHYNVSVGYLPMTQENILQLAFSALGDRYGWGGMLGSNDCSYYAKQIYKCFGLDIPRDTGLIAAMPECVTDVKALSDEEKLELLSTMPIGTILYFKGHVFIYIGMDQNTPYVINAVGSMCISEQGEGVSVNSVVINPLTVRRGAKYNYGTWLEETEAFISPSKKTTSDFFETKSDEKTDEDEQIIEEIKKEVDKEGQNVATSNDVEIMNTSRTICEAIVFFIMLTIIVLLLISNVKRRRRR